MEAMIVRDVVVDITTHYLALSALVPLGEIQDAEEYEKAVAVLDQLLDVGAGEQAHPLAELVELLGESIARYETEHYTSQAAPPGAILRLLMEQRSLTEGDLPELGSEVEVLEILNGSRKLSLQQTQIFVRPL